MVRARGDRESVMQVALPVEMPLNCSPRARGEEVPVGRPDVRGRRGVREARRGGRSWLHMNFAVVLAQQLPAERAASGVGRVRAPAPLPGVAEELGEPPAGPGGPGVQVIPIQEVPRDGRRRRGDLPLGLRRQPSPAPAGEGVGLVVADVADRLGLVEAAGPAQRECPPGAVDPLPVQRRLPSLGLDGGPAVREPEVGTPVAAVASTNARYSPTVTGRQAIRNGSRNTRCRGPSLSKVNPPRRRARSGGLRLGVNGAHAALAGRPRPMAAARSSR